jgi:hypothetical protein
MILALLLVANAFPSDEVRTRVESAPRKIAAFVTRRANCNHFLGEEPYDDERAAELEKTIRELRCKRIDRDERNLRRAYRGNSEVLQLLADTADALGW